MKKFSVAIGITALACALALAGCAANSGSNSADVSGYSRSQESAQSTATAVTITKTAGQQLADTLQPYESDNDTFTMSLPAGWVVEHGSYDMFYWIHAYDPTQPELFVYTLMKADVILKSQASKNWYVSTASAYPAYQMFADAAWVDGDPATDNLVAQFYSRYFDYVAFVNTWEATYAGFTFPPLGEFELIESWDYTSFVSSVALQEKLCHGTFVDPLTQAKGECLVTGSLVDQLTYPAAGTDLGLYGMYNVHGIAAPYGMLAEYEDVLTQILSSITYTDTYVRTTMRGLELTNETIKEVGRICAATSDIIYQGWLEREASYDRISQKWSDATLGYERVYDTDTGEVYKAPNGFTDVYDGTRFAPITEDMYSAPIAGYIQ